MAEDVLRARSLLNSLFAYQYQVIPFVCARRHERTGPSAVHAPLCTRPLGPSAVLTVHACSRLGPCADSHLVSAGSFLYLLGLAVLKGASFSSGAPLLSGLWLPLLSFLIATITAIGLIEIGQAIANPWGIDPEDFAVPTFLQVTAKASRLLIELPITSPLGDEPTDIGTPDLSSVHSECAGAASEAASVRTSARHSARQSLRPSARRLHAWRASGRDSHALNQAPHHGLRSSAPAPHARTVGASVGAAVARTARPIYEGAHALRKATGGGQA